MPNTTDLLDLELFRDLVRRVDGADLTNGDILALIGLLQQAMKSNGLR
ncbi:MAG: hypothetical protein KDB72_21000 [Mycobacterium sp.]|nr:hypothetical protein [Mycobacterium sp.]